VGTPTRVTPAGALDRPPLLPELVPTVLYRLAVAVAVLALACYASKLARQLLGRRIARRFKRPSVSRTVLQIIQGATAFLGLVVALGFLGLGFGNLALSVGVFSAVLGIVLAPIIGNVLSVMQGGAPDLEE
jgi:small-conductance mechanosensitive channel